MNSNFNLYVIIVQEWPEEENKKLAYLGKNILDQMTYPLFLDDSVEYVGLLPKYIF